MSTDKRGSNINQCEQTCIARTLYFMFLNSPPTRYVTSVNECSYDRANKRTKGGQMNDMGGVVFFVQFLGLFRISEDGVRLLFTRNEQKRGPKIPLWGTSKDPFLAWFLPESRALWFRVDNMFNGLADQSCSSSNENDLCHAAHLPLEVTKVLWVYSGAYH